VNIKQQVFLEEYLCCWNATEAAKRAGYKHPNKQGPRLLVHVGIQEAVQKRLQEKHMSADEVLARVAEIARGIGSEYFDEDGNFDFLKARDDDKMHLVHSVARTDGEKSSSLKVEIYDALTALNMMGKNLKLWNEDQKPVIPSEITVRFVKSDEQKDA